MKTGIELITEERLEQTQKHDWSIEHDLIHTEGQLRLAAIYALQPFTESEGINSYIGWESFTDKIELKSEVERLKVAGALIAAEIDRINN